MTASKIFNDICLVSREGVCLLDMKQVAAAAKRIGLTDLAETIATDLSENKVLTGKYALAVAPLYGVTS